MGSVFHLPFGASASTGQPLSEKDQAQQFFRTSCWQSPYRSFPNFLLSCEILEEYISNKHDADTLLKDVFERMRVLKDFTPTFLKEQDGYPKPHVTAMLLLSGYHVFLPSLDKKLDKEIIQDIHQLEMGISLPHTMFDRHHVASVRLCFEILTALSIRDHFHLIRFQKLNERRNPEYHSRMFDFYNGAIVPILANFERLSFLRNMLQDLILRVTCFHNHHDKMQYSHFIASMISGKEVLNPTLVWEKLELEDCPEVEAAFHKIFAVLKEQYPDDPLQAYDVLIEKGITPLLNFAANTNIFPSERIMILSMAYGLLQDDPKLPLDLDDLAPELAHIYKNLDTIGRDATSPDNDSNPFDDITFQHIQEIKNSTILTQLDFLAHRLYGGEKSIPPQINAHELVELGRLIERARKINLQTLDLSLELKDPIMHFAIEAYNESLKRFPKLNLKPLPPYSSIPRLPAANSDDPNKPPSP
jgi:hypothetical protein